MTYQIYLPVIMQGKPLHLGAQIEHHLAPSCKQWIPNPAECPRQIQVPLKWRDVETVKEVLNWSPYDADFAALAGQSITAGIKVVPEWARLWPGYVASPPREDCYQALAHFAIAVIERYKPNAIELFNEPDVPRDLTKIYEEFFGAWCIGEGFYSGGNLYGKCLKAVYPIIKGAHPEVKIIVGALIGENPSSVQFYQGALQATEGAKPWDAWSVHKYIRMGGNFNAAFEIANLIGATVLSETSIRSTEDSDALKAEQADYLRHLLANYQNSTIEVIEWFTLGGNGWDCTDLVREGMPTPVYHVWCEGG